MSNAVNFRSSGPGARAQHAAAGSSPRLALRPIAREAALALRAHSAHRSPAAIEAAQPAERARGSGRQQADLQCRRWWPKGGPKSVNTRAPKSEGSGNLTDVRLLHQIMRISCQTVNFRTELQLPAKAGVCSRRFRASSVR